MINPWLIIQMINLLVDKTNQREKRTSHIKSHIYLKMSGDSYYTLYFIAYSVEHSRTCHYGSL